MKNSAKFFNNHDCEYFPCHTQPAPERFNCLFCYCPLYTKADCGGHFEYINGIKSCMDCHMPHVPESYGQIIKRLAT